MKSFFVSIILFLLLPFTQNNIFAQTPTEAPGPEIVYPQSSNFCNEFLIQIKKGSQNPHNPDYPLPPESSGKAEENAGGDLTLDNNAFPDFEQMKKDLEKAVIFLTPQEILEDLKVEGPSLETKAKHFVLGKDEENNLISPQQEKIPETKIIQPGWFTNLLGNSRWICGIFGTCPAAKSPNIKVSQAEVEINYEAYKKYCLQTNPEIPETETVRENLQTQFVALSLWEKTVRIIERTIDNIKRFFIKEEKETFLTVKTQGEMAGGSNFSVYSDFQNTFIPQKFIEELWLKTGSLATKTNNYTISAEGEVQNQQKPINYSDKAKELLKRCMAVCSFYPSDFNVSSVEPLCPSCNPADYELEYIQVDKKNCHWIEGSGCDYKDDSAGPSCSGDPICESGKCYPNMYRMIGDYTNQGCTPPYQGNGCTIPEICFSVNFKPNPAGGFGPCQYQNPNVCLRTDWIQDGVGKCDHLCNWACCEYQK